MRKETRCPEILRAVLLGMLFLSVPMFAQKFDEPLNIRERLGIPDNADAPLSMTFDGLDVYATWVIANLTTREWTLYSAHSADAGQSFQVTKVAYSRFQDIYSPLIAESDGTLYIAHTQGPCTPGVLYFYRLTREGTSSYRLLLNGGREGIWDEHLAAADNKVYIAWRRDLIDFNIYLAYSTDYGETFSEPIRLTDEPAVRRNVTGLIATGNDIYIKWNLDRQSFLIHGAITEAGFKVSK